MSTKTYVTVFVIPETSYPIVYIRTILGTIVVLFLPGFMFLKVQYPNSLPFNTSSKNFEAIERIALSIGMSIALIPIVDIVLNYTPFGIRLTPVALCLLALTVLFATAAILSFS